MTTDPILWACEYIVSPLPLEDPNADVFSLRVAWRGRFPGRTPRREWAVLNRSWCLSRSGEWDLEVQPSSRTDRWLGEHRFDLDDAVQRAVGLLPTLTVNGLCVVDGQVVRRSADPPGEGWVIGDG